jgi:hypothetical protein
MAALVRHDCIRSHPGPSTQAPAPPAQVGNSDTLQTMRNRRSTWPSLLGTAAIAAGGGNDVETSTPAEFGAPVKSELIRWKGVVQKAKLTAD